MSAPLVTSVAAPVSFSKGCIEQTNGYAIRTLDMDAVIEWLGLMTGKDGS
ncbi:hypothetical protein [Paramesorhizobium deserti]|nr:hypothetical protein [Paramesorhizobium deserti]